MIVKSNSKTLVSRQCCKLDCMSEPLQQPETPCYHWLLSPLSYWQKNARKLTQRCARSTCKLVKYCKSSKIIDSLQTMWIITHLDSVWYIYWMYWLYWLYWLFWLYWMNWLYWLNWLYWTSRAHSLTHLLIC